MIQFLGIKTDVNGWEHFAWIATLNGVDIEYKTGLGHSKSPYILDAARCIESSPISKIFFYVLVVMPTVYMK